MNGRRLEGKLGCSKKNPDSIKALTDVLIKDNKKAVTVETNIKSCNI